MSDEFSDFKSAIDWRELREEEVPDGDGFRPFGVGLREAIDNAAHAYVVAGKAESPIEVQFGGYVAGNLSRKLKDVGIQLEIGQPRATVEPTVFFVPQYIVGRFRYDFAIIVQGCPAILIECDGKEFHETPEAQANDRLKDAKALEIGARMIRFSGSEIYRDLKGCADHVISVLAGWP